MSGAQIASVNELTDTGQAGASAMANSNGSNTKIGNAIRALVNKTPAIGNMPQLDENKLQQSATCNSRLGLLLAWCKA